MLIRFTSAVKQTFKYYYTVS